MVFYGNCGYSLWEIKGLSNICKNDLREVKMVLEGLDMTNSPKGWDCENNKTTKDWKRSKKVGKILNRYTIVWRTHRYLEDKYENK